ncbi:ribonuclease Z [Porphyromonas macacae]|uniref:ribonuclease Z n=1 Tax=Porphyromonas macacae TaxID=28115 RepID=UPI00359FB7AC
MEKFDIHILGCGSATPTTKHWPACQVLDIRGKLYMIDCGEGCQYNYRRSRLNFSRLRAVFISHLHGDHCFGLPGLISSMSLLGRTGILEIYGPEGIREYMDRFMKLFGARLAFEIEVHTIDCSASRLIYEDPSVKISSLPLKHRIECAGFLVEEKSKSLHLDKESCDFFQIPITAYKQILRGEDFVTETGETISNSRLTKKGCPPRKYAYCSDTAYRPALVPLIQEVTLLYHEATFRQSDLSRARETYHSTAAQAAMIAKEANVKRLLIGHYSARYPNEEGLLEEAKNIFPETIAAQENQIIRL